MQALFKLYKHEKIFLKILAIYNYITKKIVYLNAANTHFENMIKISENEILAQNDDLDIKILK